MTHLALREYTVIMLSEQQDVLEKFVQATMTLTRIFVDERHLCSQPLWGQIVELCRSAAAIESRAEKKFGSVNRLDDGIESRRAEMHFTPGPLILMNKSGAGAAMFAPDVDDEASTPPGSSTTQGERIVLEPHQTLRRSPRISLQGPPVYRGLDWPAPKRKRTSKRKSRDEESMYTITICNIHIV
ncbi:hypothetical protein DPMN_108116 [Dreissena polymorpha]|uniref:Uncharacterized protein n=1 Tax=Dreissena polymorpha TaxID=45954 RepID=A0A9D4QKL7_DREPO|nr:hypothetical protein DPMN_108116 [Dreissena polymorpha]